MRTCVVLQTSGQDGTTSAAEHDVCVEETMSAAEHDICEERTMSAAEHGPDRSSGVVQIRPALRTCEVKTKGVTQDTDNESVTSKFADDADVYSTNDDDASTTAKQKCTHVAGDDAYSTHDNEVPIFIRRSGTPRISFSLRFQRSHIDDGEMRSQPKGNSLLRKLSSTNTCINTPLHGHPDALMNPWKIPDCFATPHNTVTEDVHIVHWGRIHKCLGGWYGTAHYYCDGIPQTAKLVVQPEKNANFARFVATGHVRTNCAGVKAVMTKQKGNGSRALPHGAFHAGNGPCLRGTRTRRARQGHVTCQARPWPWHLTGAVSGLIRAAVDSTVAGSELSPRTIRQLARRETCLPAANRNSGRHGEKAICRGRGGTPRRSRRFHAGTTSSADLPRRYVVKASDYRSALRLRAGSEEEWRVMSVRSLDYWTECKRRRKSLSEPSTSHAVWLTRKQRRAASTQGGTRVSPGQPLCARTRAGTSRALEVTPSRSPRLASSTAQPRPPCKQRPTGRGGVVIKLLTSNQRSPPEFSHVGESRRTMPLVGGFSRGSPVFPLSPFFHSGAASYSPHFTLVGSQDVDCRVDSSVWEVLDSFFAYGQAALTASSGITSLSPRGGGGGSVDSTCRLRRPPSPTSLTFASQSSREYRGETSCSHREPQKCKREKKNSFTGQQDGGMPVTDHRLTAPPLTKANRVQSQAGSLWIFVCGNRAGRCRAGQRVFSGISLPPPSSWRRSILTSTTLIASQNLAVKSRPNHFTSLKKQSRNVSCISGHDSLTHWWQVKSSPFLTTPSPFISSQWIINYFSPVTGNHPVDHNTLLWPCSSCRIRYLATGDFVGIDSDAVGGHFSAFAATRCNCRIRKYRPSSYRNEEARKKGVPRENPPTNGIVRHDSHMRKSGVTRPGIEPGSPWWEASRLTAQPPLVFVDGESREVREWNGGSAGRGALFVPAPGRSTLAPAQVRGDSAGATGKKKVLSEVVQSKLSSSAAGSRGAVSAKQGKLTRRRPSGDGFQVTSRARHQRDWSSPPSTVERTFCLAIEGRVTQLAAIAPPPSGAPVHFASVPLLRYSLFAVSSHFFFNETLYHKSWAAVARALASHLGDPGSISGGPAPGFSARGNHAGRCRLPAGFSRGTPVSPALAFQRRSLLRSQFTSCPGMTGTYGPKAVGALQERPRHEHQLSRRLYAQSTELACSLAADNAPLRDFQRRLYHHFMTPRRGRSFATAGMTQPTKQEREARPTCVTTAEEGSPWPEEVSPDVRGQTRRRGQPCRREQRLSAAAERAPQFVVVTSLPDPPTFISSPASALILTAIGRDRNISRVHLRTRQASNTCTLKLTSQRWPSVTGLEIVRARQWVSEESWTALNVEVLRADEVWSSAGMRGRGKREIPEKTRRPTALSGTIPTREKFRSNPAGD
ncbi:hypothetical protein PR048_000359 [Dryococelus australis]|uniref:Uncharacterized protein n=1 Tax=Dryococelus australis TaxID=614101 RepID=A0ABQ9IEE0_9NEOP|nr:hypothetical protein PR048_000359 [Dryococelus australis]